MPARGAQLSSFIRVVFHHSGVRRATDRTRPDFGRHAGMHPQGSAHLSNPAKRSDNAPFSKVRTIANVRFHCGRNYTVRVTVFSQRPEFERLIIHMVRAVVRILMFLASFGAGLWLATTLARADATPQPLVGQWSLNKDLSDVSSSSDQRGDNGSRGESGRGRGGYGGGGGHHGGYGGGAGGYGAGRSSDRDGGRDEDMARRADAIRQIMIGADRLTISATDSMVIVTDSQGRTTRLSLDGKKIKDESTGIERKTKWDGTKLVSEISGAGSGTITQSYQVDPEHHQLTITLQPPSKNGAPPPRHFVYDAADAR
jgi:hypothetical protein